MTAKELRIGNYVELEGLISKVVSICFKKENHIEIRTPHNHIVEVKLNAVNPVPLSGELLFKCCEFDQQGKHTLGIDHERHYFKVHDGYIVLLNKKNEALIHFWDVKYLHRLQNLYYALKGKEMGVVFS